MDILEPKDFPKEYPAEAVKVLNAMTFTDTGLKVVGSSALRSQLYAGDYDGYETVEGFTLDGLVKKFKEIIKNLRVYDIGDIKSGEIEKWRVVPQNKKDYNVRKATEKVESLLKDGIISSEEAEEAKKVLPSYLVAKQEIKFQVVRWTPEEAIAGHKKLRDGSDYTLKEAFQSPAITKVDVIAKVKGVYTEFSVIYEFIVDGKPLNKVSIEPEASLKESIAYYKEVDNPYKVLKRKFALAKLKNDLPAIKRYSKIINSELGRFYKLYSDIKTLGDLLETRDAPIPKFDTEGIPKDIVADLSKVKSKADLPILRHIEEQLFDHLSKGTRLRGGMAYRPFNG